MSSLQISDATTIASHSGSTKMGCFVICVTVNATVTLYENEDGTFYLHVDYNYSGSKSGSGSQNIPVSGNASGSKSAGSDIELDYAITNWQKTDTTISFNLTASISHTSFPKMGPDYIFNNQNFSGTLATQQMAEDDARFAKYVVLHNKLTDVAGTSVEHVYKKD